MLESDPTDAWRTHGVEWFSEKKYAEAKYGGLLLSGHGDDEAQVGGGRRTGMWSTLANRQEGLRPWL